MADSVDHVPRYSIRWLRPAYSTALLDLPTAPVTQTSSDAWRAFSEDESAACEAAWQRLPKDLQHNSGEDLAAIETDDSLEDDTVGVAIMRDRLFEVDVRTMQLKPVYWKLTGNPIPVMRAHWMFDETRPVPKALNDQLEKAYRKTKPWLAMYAEELRAALSAGTAEAHNKLKRELPGNDQGQSVVFQDGGSARIVSDNLAFRVQQSLYSSFMSTPHPIAFPGATPVYRGYEAAQKAASSGTSTKAASRSSTPPHGRQGSSNSDKPAAEKKSTQPQEERELVHTDAATKTGEEEDGDVTDIVFIVHGIGQGLAAQYEGLNFVYATNLFRQVARKQSAMPALSTIMRSRRVQFLPLMWRTGFGLSVDEMRTREEEGLDNRFTLEDITLKGSIPFVRELANNVILDVPYFMSNHREAMIQSVCVEANTVYRKWCKRNPGFDKDGRIHVIAHSLGSALVTHVLSSQPTRVPPLSERSKDELVDTPKNQFLFDTSALFLAGSPLSMFMLLDQRQLIARKGRERTKDCPPDEAVDRVGLFGCLAVDSIYNVFYPSDPIAYRLNPVVDSKLAVELPPSAITTINASFFDRLTKLFAMPALPAMPTLPAMPQLPQLPAWKLPFTSRTPSRPSTPDDKGKEQRGARPPKPAPNNSDDLELPTKGSESGHARAPSDADPKRTRAERRFAALNPHGTLDFYLPAEGGISEYIDMVTAHLSYWSDSTFASFVLAEIFAKHEDRLRTGVGVDQRRKGQTERTKSS
ncbi:hypothetical protein AURDEDRAFT_182151 [Auricularia subglabra TFB-10046 SS5]|nr:hypothetical protein AURDEDRAFT_182151 [Auricularia subglabra TFB-10046 SS5]